MRLNLKSMMLAVVGVFLLGSGPPLASQSLSIATPGKDKMSMLLSERAYTLLLEIQKEAVGLRDHAETLSAIARNYQHSEGHREQGLRETSHEMPSTWN